MSLINLENISLYFAMDTPPVLDNINWTIEESEAWVLFGRNGAGKSKLLEIITGYQRQTHGRISRFGHEELGSDIRMLRKYIGYVASHIKNEVHPNERAGDMIASGYFATIGLYDIPQKELTDKTHALLDELGLGNRYDDLFSHFSDGEKQKILLARALINDPLLLILDEPTSGLDIAAREELLDSLEESYMKRGHSLIYVTHHVEEIRPFMKKTVVLKSGEIHTSDRTEAAINSDSISTIFERPVRVEKIDDRYYTFVKKKPEQKNR